MKTRTSDRHLRWLVLVPAAAATLAVAAGVVSHLLTPDIPFLSRLMAQVMPPYFYYMASLEALMAARARSFFSPGQALRFAWGWLALAALVRLIGFLLSHAAERPLAGQLVSSVFAGFLGFLGMARVISALQVAGWVQPLRWTDRFILSVLWIYLAHHLWLVVQEIATRGLRGPLRTAMWLVVPLLLALAWQALTIRRAMLALGGGRLAQCWGAIAAGVLLVVAGNISQLAQPLLHLAAGPWLLLDAIWILPFALYALAPALQVEASALALDSTALRALDQKHAGEDDRHRR